MRHSIGIPLTKTEKVPTMLYVISTEHYGYYSLIKHT